MHPVRKIILLKILRVKFSAALFTILFSAVILSFGNNKGRKYLEGLGFHYIPAGVVYSDSGEVSVRGFYMYEAEITNGQYAEFLQYLKKHDRQADLQMAGIHNGNWETVLSFENTYAADYHTDPAFVDYPVVNITYEAAQLFCDYLQEMIREKVPDAYVRLPDEIEWIHAAKGGKNDAEYPWENLGVNGKKEVEFCNYNSPDDGTCLATNLSRSYYPNAYGLYNMSGNVAEMLETKGRTKGGSWGSTAIQMRITAPDEYAGFDDASPFIGFRPVVILP